MSAETVHYDDTPTPVATRPIERRHGAVFIGGTNVVPLTVWADVNDGMSYAEAAEHNGITPEQAEYAWRYQERRQKRKDPVARKLKANGRACKQRGYEFEKHIEARLAGFGFKRTMMSGALGGAHSGDLRRERQERVKACPRCLEGIDVVEPALLVECKRMEAEQRFFRNALAQGGGSQAVVVGKKGIEPLVVMELATFEAMLRAADYEVTP